MVKVQRMVRRTIFLFLAWVLMPLLGTAQDVDGLYRMETIVIDAGHGGKDPGNLGTGRYKAREKDIALEVALRVGTYIRKQFPEIEVIYTRSTDVFIGLNERADIANKAKADLFISIHCNAFTKETSHGVETYALGLHRNKENLQVAMKENSSITLEKDYKTKYEGFDPNSAESIIALTIMQSAFLQQSLSLSSHIQKQFRERVGRTDRGVKQAGFLVLRRTTMPSVLVELGFLTNTSEEDFLNSENGKAYMSSAIFRGFKEYKDMVEDPLPEGYVAPEQEDKPEEKTVDVDAEKVKNDSIEKAEKQAVVQAIADSLEQVKQNLLEEKRAREAGLENEEVVKKENLKAEADSLELRKQQLLEEKRKMEVAAKAAEIAAEKKKQADLNSKADSLELKKQALIVAKQKREDELTEESRIKQEAAKKQAAEKALAEKQRLEDEKRKQEAATQSKEDAKEWLEEIKSEKEKELAEAKGKAEIEAEKKRLEEIRSQKKQELADAKAVEETRLEKLQIDSVSAAEKTLEVARQKAHDELAARLEKEQLQAEEGSEKVKEDSIAQVKILEEQRIKALEAVVKAKEDSIAAAKEVEEQAITIGNKKAATPEEAELLFLQLRKRQLEQRIAELTGKNVRARTVVAAKEPEKKIASPAAIRSEDPAMKGIVLSVQIITSAEPLAESSPKFKGETVKQYQQGGLYKYTVGGTADFEKITKLQGELRNLGFQGAFVVAFQNGERIKVSEARKMLAE
ncbi:MAG: N-acetylmuramoyl-L-alanine amidase [Flavobacteriales bacterium]|nr:N-acetylmuramoyl-L-alanine amidase [Flavobacteriales bacterium]